MRDVSVAILKQAPCRMCRKFVVIFPVLCSQQLRRKGGPIEDRNASVSASDWLSEEILEPIRCVHRRHLAVPDCAFRRPSIRSVGQAP